MNLRLQFLCWDPAGRVRASVGAERPVLYACATASRLVSTTQLIEPSGRHAFHCTWPFVTWLGILRSVMTDWWSMCSYYTISRQGRLLVSKQHFFHLWYIMVKLIWRVIKAWILLNPSLFPRSTKMANPFLIHSPQLFFCAPCCFRDCCCCCSNSLLHFTAGNCHVCSHWL